MSEKAGVEMCAKGVILWGLFGEIGVKEGQFLASKAGKKAVFFVQEGKLEVAEGFSGQNRTLCHNASRTGITPWGNAKG
jgi:hypothetical protein